MAVYAVSQEGVNELNTRAQQLDASCANIAQLCLDILNAASENREVMGPHIDELIEIIQEIKQVISDGTDEVKALVLVLRKIAQRYEDIIAHKLGGRSR